MRKDFIFSDVLGIQTKSNQIPKCKLVLDSCWETGSRRDRWSHRDGILSYFLLLRYELDLHIMMNEAEDKSETYCHEYLSDMFYAKQEWKNAILLFSMSVSVSLPVIPSRSLYLSVCLFFSLSFSLSLSQSVLLCVCGFSTEERGCQLYNSFENTARTLEHFVRTEIPRSTTAVELKIVFPIFGKIFIKNDSI